MDVGVLGIIGKLIKLFFPFPHPLIYF